MKLDRAHRFVWAALLCASCIPPRLTADAADGAGGGAPPDGAGGASVDARDAPPEAAPMGGQLTLAITADGDDALWIGGTDERLHYSSTNLTLEVGVDAEIGRTGLRFAVTLPRGTLVTSAKLGLRRHVGELATPSTMIVQVYDSVDVPPFSDLHAHLPENHDPNHLWGSTVEGFAVCDDDQICVSPEIAKLVQRILDKSEWTGTGFIGFVLAPDEGDFAANGWVGFEDSSFGGAPPTLEITYAPPS